MTGCFDPKLEPGETIRLRFPVHRHVVRFGWLMVAVLLVAAIYQLSGGKPLRAVVSEFATYVGTAVLVCVVAFALLVRWRVVVTDRRVAMRPGYLTWAYRDVPLDEIEAVGINRSRMSVRGRGGRELSARVGHLSAVQIAAAMGAPHSLRESPDEPPQALLEPGEAILYREPTGWQAELLDWWLISSRWNARIFAGALGLTARRLALAKWTLLPLVLALVLMLPSEGARRRRDPWLLVVTGRRLMARLDYAESFRHAEIRLAEIERIRYDRAHRELVLDGPRHRVMISRGRRGAKRIVAAIRQAREAAT